MEEVYAITRSFTIQSEQRIELQKWQEAINLIYGEYGEFDELYIVKQNGTVLYRNYSYLIDKSIEFELK